MLVILLDCSSSMNAFLGADETRLQAAKRAVADALQQIDLSTHLAIVAFNHSAWEVFRGTPRQMEHISHELAGLQSTGGTSVEAGVSFLLEHYSSPLQVIIVTDGEFIGEGALRALQQGGGVIRIILIGNEREAYPFPRKSRHESLVDSAQELHKEVATVAAAMARPAKPDNVSFVVDYPPCIKRGQWYPLWFAAFAESMREIVLKMLDDSARAAGLSTNRSQSPSTRVMRGEKIRVVAEVPGMTFGMSAFEFEWSGEFNIVPFQAKVDDPNQGNASGCLRITVRGVTIAILPMVIQIAEVAPITASLTRSTAAMTREVFASYSRKDLPIVGACAAVYEALGIRVLRDHLELRTGDDFPTGLKNLISGADIFQLYWSSRAARSQWVEREWRHALGLCGPAGPKAANFICPVVWQKNPPALPNELQHTHYYRLGRSLFEALASSVDSPRELMELAARLNADTALDDDDEDCNVDREVTCTAPSGGHIADESGRSRPADTNKVDTSSGSSAFPKRPITMADAGSPTTPAPQTTSSDPLADLDSAERLAYDKVAELIGAELFAADGCYLGTISQYTDDHESILNRYCRYGSRSLPHSIMNASSDYGSVSGKLSPFNPNGAPVVAMRNGIQVGILGVALAEGYYRADLVLRWLQDHACKRPVGQDRPPPRGFR